MGVIIYICIQKADLKNISVFFFTIYMFKFNYYMITF